MQEKMRFHIESEQPGRNEAMNEWLDEHRAIFTALDENFPTPEEITSEEVLMLPEIQSMSAYIRQHFEEEIVAEVSRKIRHGELSVICGCSQREELVFAGAKDLFPRKGRITWIDFRRTEDHCVEADLTLEIEIEIQLDRSRQVVRQRYRADMWLDLEEDIDIEYGNIRLYRREGEKKGIRLDEYLIPVFRWDDIEEEAERIIQWINPEGLSDPAQLQANLFADRLGLRVIQLPLYNRPQTESILFFGAGTVQVAINGECTNEEWMLVPVAANTIVLNTIPGREKNAIFHECFHYVEHRLFYQLQRMHNNDVSRLAQWRPVRLEKNKRSPIEWLEWQAHVGSQCLQMPRSLLRQQCAGCKMRATTQQRLPPLPNRKHGHQDDQQNDADCLIRFSRKQRYHNPHSACEHIANPSCKANDFRVGFQRYAPFKVSIDRYALNGCVRRASAIEPLRDEIDPERIGERNQRRKRGA